MRPLTSPADPRAGGAVQGYDEWFGETARSPGRPGWSAPRDIKPMPFARPSAHPADGGQVASLRARVEQLVSKLHADTHAFRAEKRALRSAAESAQRLRVKAEVGQAQAEAEAAWARAELDRVRSSVDAERSQAEAATRALASELDASRTELARYREEVAKQAGALEALHALIETQGLFLPPPHARGEPGKGKPGSGHGNGLPASPYPPRAQARRRRTSGDRDVDDEDDSWETSDEGVTRLRRIAEGDEDAARAAEEMAERSPPTGRGPVEAAPPSPPTPPESPRQQRMNQRRRRQLRRRPCRLRSAPLTTATPCLATCWRRRSASSLWRIGTATPSSTSWRLPTCATRPRWRRR